MSTDTLVRPSTGDPALDQEPGRKTHIVKPKDDKSAQALVLESALSGAPVEALCGHLWVPGRDPQKFPLCEQCKELFDAEFGEGASDDLT